MQTSTSKSARQDPVEFLKREAETHGFDAVGVTGPDRLAEAGARVRDFVALGRHGGMAWMESELDRRADPRTLWPDVRSIAMFAMNYGPDTDPLDKSVETSPPPPSPSTPGTATTTSSSKAA